MMEENILKRFLRLVLLTGSGVMFVFSLLSFDNYFWRALIYGVIFGLNILIALGVFDRVRGWRVYAVALPSLLGNFYFVYLGLSLLINEIAAPFVRVLVMLTALLGCHFSLQLVRGKSR